MGLGADYRCGGCGYVAKQLLTGVAPDPRAFDPVLVVCPRCRELKSLDRRKTRCPKHRVPYVQFHEDKPVPCPKCGVELELSEFILWD